MNFITLTIQNDWQTTPAMAGFAFCQATEQTFSSLCDCLISGAEEMIRSVPIGVWWNSSAEIGIIGSLTEAKYRFREECSALFENLVFTFRAAWNWLFEPFTKTARKVVYNVRESILTARTVLQTTRRMRI